jgi:hypothetical protein
MNIGQSLETFMSFEDEDIHELILGIASDQPELFIEITDAIEAEIHLSILQEMREETCNGYPIYPELQW